MCACHNKLLHVCLETVGLCHPDSVQTTKTEGTQLDLVTDHREPLKIGFCRVSTGYGT